MVTFGQKYHRQPHPVLGEDLTPDHWVVILAEDYDLAQAALEHMMPEMWSNLEDAETFDESYYPKGEFAVINVSKVERGSTEHMNMNGELN